MLDNKFLFWKRKMCHLALDDSRLATTSQFAGNNLQGGSSKILLHCKKIEKKYNNRPIRYATQY